MFFTPLAEAKFGRSFVRMSPRPGSVKTPTTPPTVASKPATTLVQTPTTTQPTSASTIANTTSTSVPVQPVTTLPATSNISASPTYSIAPAAGPAAPVANTAVTAAKPVLPAPLTVVSPVYSSRPSTTKTPESSTMQNIAVGVLGGLGIAMLADSLFGDDNSSSASQSTNAADSNSASSSASSFSSLLLTAGLVVLFLGLVWFAVSEYIRHRRRTAR